MSSVTHSKVRAIRRKRGISNCLDIIELVGAALEVRSPLASIDCTKQHLLQKAKEALSRLLCCFLLIDLLGPRTPRPRIQAT